MNLEDKLKPGMRLRSKFSNNEFIVLQPNLEYSVTKLNIVNLRNGVIIDLTLLPFTFEESFEIIND